MYTLYIIKNLRFLWFQCCKPIKDHIITVEMVNALVKKPQKARWCVPHHLKPHSIDRTEPSCTKTSKQSFFSFFFFFTSTMLRRIYPSEIDGPQQVLCPQSNIIWCWKFRWFPFLQNRNWRVIITDWYGVKTRMSLKVALSSLRLSMY